MAGDDHPDRKVVAAGESSKGKAILEEGEIAEEEEDPKAESEPPPSPPPPPPSPPPPPPMTTSPAATHITVEPPPVKKIKIINAGGSSATAPPPPPPRQIPCPLCQRMFDSYPAMFGHQRVHKERTYRGAFPPPTFSREGSPPALPTAEDTEQAARQAAQLLIDISKGVWEKAPAAVPGEPSSSSAQPVLGLDLNLPLEPETEPEEENKEEEADDRKKNLNLDLNKSPQNSD